MTRRATRLVGAAMLIASTVALTAGPAAAAAKATDTIGVENGDTVNGLQTWSFTGVDATYEAGKLLVTLDNNTGAPHELVVFKLTDEYEDVTTAELRELADEQADGVIESFAGAVFAEPMSDDDGKLKLKEAGTYAYFCFIGPENATPEQLHYNRGLIGTFEVTE